MTSELSVLEHAQSTLVELAIKFGPKLVVAVLIVVAGFYAGRWVGVVFDRWLNRLHLDVSVRLLLVRVSRLLVLGLFLIMALQNLGVDLVPLIAGLGVAGAGVALAMQGVLGNLAAGLTIIFTRPFRVGEYIAIVGVEGQVEAVDLFSTRLSHTDQSVVVIPNRKIVGEILHNYGRIKQLDLSLALSRAEDLEAALTAVGEAVAGHPAVLAEPAALVGVTALNDANIIIAVKPWVQVDAVATAGGEINQAIVARLRAAGVDYPPAARNVRLVDAAGSPR